MAQGPLLRPPLPLSVLKNVAETGGELNIRSMADSLMERYRKRFLGGK